MLKFKRILTFKKSKKYKKGENKIQNLSFKVFNI